MMQQCVGVGKERCRVLTARMRCRDCERENNGRQGLTSREYDVAWRRLTAEAVESQPWCTDCEAEHSEDNPLSTDHLRWPVHTVQDVDVVCHRCSNRRSSVRVEFRGSSRL